jgi:hypothetical protein
MLEGYRRAKGVKKVVLDIPDESNVFFGAQRILKELNVLPDTTGTFDFLVLTVTNDVFGCLRQPDPPGGH